MYRIQHFDRSCRVLDADDRIVFAGSFRECEDWLDLAENRGKKPASAPRPARPTLWKRLCAWLSRPAPAEPPATESDAVASRHTTPPESPPSNVPRS